MSADAQAIRQKLLIEQRRQMLKKMQADQLASKPQDEVVDEMPEWLSDTDRLKAKNLTNNENEQVAFLQKQYPDAEVKSDGSRVLLRKKGESAYKVLDPSFSVGRMFSAEGLRDLGDIAGDIVQGGAEAVGAAAGAAGGLPGVMAGSAVASGAASSAKEKLAEMLGVKEADYGNAAVDAAIGGLIPGGLAVAGKGAKFAAKKAAPWLYSKATGLSTGALKEVADGAADMGRQDPLELIRSAKQSIADEIGQTRSNFTQAFGAKRGSGVKVKIDPAIERIDKLLAEARAESARSGSKFLSEKERLLQGLKDRILAKTGKAPSGLKYDPSTGHLDVVTPDVHHLGGEMDVGDVMNLKSRTSAEYLDFDNHLNNGFGSGNSISAEERRGAKALYDTLDDVIYGDDVAGQELKKEFGEAVKAAEYLDGKFFTEDKAQATLRNMRKDRDQVLRGNIDKLSSGTKKKLSDVNRKLEIDEFFNEPNKELGGNYIKKGADTVLGRSPLTKSLSTVGGFLGFKAGSGPGGAAGIGIGRALGELLTSPESVKQITKGAKKMGLKMDNLEQLLKERPEMIRILYGAGAAATQD